MPRVRALKTEGGRRRGEEFDVTEAEARILTALDLPGGPKAILIDRTMRANGNDLTEPKRHYRRRDMRAQD